MESLYNSKLMSDKQSFNVYYKFLNIMIKQFLTEVYLHPVKLEIIKKNISEFSFDELCYEFSDMMKNVTEQEQKTPIYQYLSKLMTGDTTKINWNTIVLPKTKFKIFSKQTGSSRGGGCGDLGFLMKEFIWKHNGHRKPIKLGDLVCAVYRMK
jgi:hypothetical protein